MIQITLKCCTCGATKDVVITQSPGFGFEFYKIIQDSGWYPVLDMRYGKSGSIRKRLIYCPKAQNVDKTIDLFAFAMKNV